MNENETYESDVNLMDYFIIIWKRKWLILLPAVALIFLAGIYSILKPKMWEIGMIILPSECLVYDQITDIENFIAVPPSQMAIQINQRSYERLIAVELNLGNVNPIKAEHLKGTNLLSVSVRTADVKEGREILNSLSKYVRFQIIKKVEASFLSSKLKRNLLIAGILGLGIFTFLAFFVDYIEKETARSKRNVKNG